MHLTIRRYRRVEGDRQKVIDSVNKGFLPLVSRLDGFVDYHCAFLEDGSLVSVSVFRDAKGAQESGRAAAKWIEQNLAQYLPDAPEVMTGEVFAHQVAQEKKKAA
jgi:hypothetical protein